MTKVKQVKGQCLCSKVKLSVQAMSDSIHVCHCGMCRKWEGGPLFAVDCGQDVSFMGEEHIGAYHSSDWAMRGFCKHCGTHLFYRLNANQHYFMPVGLFDNQQDFVLTQQIFIEDKPAYYDFANETKNLTGEEVFAQYGS